LSNRYVQAVQISTGLINWQSNGIPDVDNICDQLSSLTNSFVVLRSDNEYEIFMKNSNNGQSSEQSFYEPDYDNLSREDMTDQIEDLLRFYVNPGVEACSLEVRGVCVEYGINLDDYIAIRQCTSPSGKTLKVDLNEEAGVPFDSFDILDWFSIYNALFPEWSEKVEEPSSIGW